MPRRHLKMATRLLLALLLIAGSAFAASPEGDAGRRAPAGTVIETLEYEWRLEGFLGTIARLVFPGRGEGKITGRELSGGRFETELEITSSASEKGEFWLYGAQIDRASGSTERVWTAYKYKEKDKQKSADVEEAGLIDVASGIHLMRRDPPERSRPMKIWSDGKTYPVRIVPGEWRDRKLANGEKVRARVYRIVGDGERDGREWKGDFEIWLADDEAATPVEILVERASVRVRLRLVPAESS